MEVSGHPSQDLIEELVARGAQLRQEDNGLWLFLPLEVFATGIDQLPRT